MFLTELNDSNETIFDELINYHYHDSIYKSKHFIVKEHVFYQNNGNTEYMK